LEDNDMKIRAIAAALIIISMFVIAAGGQNNTQVKSLAEVVLQDDKTGHYLVIDLTKGEYRFTACQTENATGGQVFTGLAKVSYSGCRIAIRDVSDTRVLLAEADLCGKQGRASLTVETTITGQPFAPPVLEYTIDDKDIRDSVAECPNAGK
jgi:hypothetical protein